METNALQSAEVVEDLLERTANQYIAKRRDEIGEALHWI